MRELKRAVPMEEKLRRSETVMRGVEGLAEFRRAKVVLLYWSMADEVQTHAFVERWYKEKTLLLPCVVGDDLVLRLKPTHDIAAELGRMKQPGQRIVAFALETDNEEANAKEKLRRKNADFIVLNSTRIPGTAFQSDDNQITIITANDATAYPKKPKREVAADIIDRLSQLLA